MVSYKKSMPEIICDARIELLRSKKSSSCQHLHLEVKHLRGIATKGFD